MLVPPLLLLLLLLLLPPLLLPLAPCASCALRALCAPAGHCASLVATATAAPCSSDESEMRRLLSCASRGSSSSLLRLVLISRGVMVGSCTNVPTLGDTLDPVGDTIEPVRSDNTSSSSAPRSAYCPKLPALAPLSSDKVDAVRLMLENEPRLGCCDSAGCCGGNAVAGRVDGTGGDGSAGGDVNAGSRIC